MGERMNYIDYRYKFPATGIGKALALLKLLSDQGLMGGAHPSNMLGDGIGPDGLPSETPALFGAVSDGHIFVHIRTKTVVPDADNLADAFGLSPTSESESAAVLGVWA